MSEPFMFRDAPSQPKQAGEELKANAEPKPKLPRKRDLLPTPDVEIAAEDDLDVLMSIVGRLQHRSPNSRARILNAIKTILDS